MWVDLDNADYTRETLDMPGCRIALRVDRTFRKTDGTVVSHDLRYYITSLDPVQVSTSDLLRYGRGHCQIKTAGIS